MKTSEYSRCVDEHADGIYRFALKMLGDTSTAQDCVQDVYERLWRHHEEVGPAEAKGYLFSSVHHWVIDQARHGKCVRLYAEEQTHAGQPTTTNGYSDIMATIDRLADQLPTAQKTVLLLRDYEGYSYEEIAQITKLSLAQVKVYIYRARLFLKSKILSPTSLI